MTVRKTCGRGDRRRRGGARLHVGAGRRRLHGGRQPRQRGRRRIGQARQRWRRLRTRRSYRSGAICAARSIRRCWPHSCIRRADSTQRQESGGGGGHGIHPRHLGHDGIDGNCAGDGKRDVWDPNDAIPSAASYDCKLASYVQDGDREPHREHARRLQRGLRGHQSTGVPPYKETQNYVKTITTLAKSFARPVSRVDPSQQAAAAIYYAQKEARHALSVGRQRNRRPGGRFDCSGLTKAAYESVGVTLPRVANDQYNAGPHPARAELLPGDWWFLLRRPHQLAGHSARRYLCGWRYDPRTANGCRHPLRPHRHPRRLLRHARDRRWRESVADDGLIPPLSCGDDLSSITSA